MYSLPKEAHPLLSREERIHRRRLRREGFDIDYSKLKWSHSNKTYEQYPTKPKIYIPVGGF